MPKGPEADLKCREATQDWTSLTEPCRTCPGIFADMSPRRSNHALASKGRGKPTRDTPSDKKLSSKCDAARRRHPCLKRVPRRVLQGKHFAGRGALMPRHPPSPATRTAPRGGHGRFLGTRVLPQYNDRTNEAREFICLLGVASCPPLTLV